MPTPILITAEEITYSEGIAPAKVIHFEGELDETAIQTLEKVIQELVETSTKGTVVVFDFGKVSYLNSRSVGQIANMHGRMQAQGGQLMLAAVPQNILDILDVVGLTMLVKAVPTVDEALSPKNLELLNR